MTGWEPWAIAAAMWWASGMTAAASAFYRTGRYDDRGLLGLAAVAGPATFLLLASCSRQAIPGRVAGRGRLPRTDGSRRVRESPDAVVVTLAALGAASVAPGLGRSPSGRRRRSCASSSASRGSTSAFTGRPTCSPATAPALWLAPWALGIRPAPAVRAFLLDQARQRS